ncbi:MAG: Ig-like domain-containing protein, partial [Caldilineaceae bacterium]
SATVAEDGVITVTLTATDVEGSALTYAIAAQPAHGTASVSGSTATYTPTADYNGSDSFTFTASDGSDTSTAATVTLTVTAVNDAPTASAGSATVAEDGVITITLTATDVEGSALTYAFASQPAHGTVSLSGSMATYTPTANYNGRDSFTFTASDGSLTSTVATVSLTVTPVNDVPVASDGSATVAEDGVITVTLTATDVEGSALTYTLASQPAHGTASVNGNIATYTPTADYNGRDSFTFTASDSSATSTPATVNVTVNAMPDLMVALVTQPAYTATFVYSGTGAIGSFTLPDGGRTQRQINLSAGSYTLQQAANVQYTTSVTCDDGASGQSRITLSLSGDDTRTCTFTNRQRGALIVTQVVEGDAPATDWAFSGPGGMTFTLPAEGGVYTFTDVLGTSSLGLTQTLPLNFSTQASCSDGTTGTTNVFPTLLPSSGQVSCVFTSTNQCTVTPAVTFPFTGGSLSAASGSGTVTVGAGLTAASTTNQVRYSGFASGATLNRSNNDYLEVRADLTGRYNIQLKFLVKRESQLNAPRNLAIDLSTDGVTFVPFYSSALPNDTVWNAVNLDLSRFGALNNNPRIAIRIYGFNATQSTARLSFDDLSLGGALPSTCAEANAPIALDSAITLAEETPTTITLSASDADGDALTYAFASQPAHGTVSLSGSMATYTPTANYNGRDSFTFTASDGSLTSTVATVSLTVTPVNDVPVASDGSATVAEDGVITVTLTATDVEGSALTYAIAAQPAHGTASVSGSTATYTPTADYNGSDSFTFTASDGS